MHVATEDQIRELRARFLATPTDVATAKRYWDALGNLNGHDVRSGRDVVDAFGHAALQSDGGAIALSSAYWELFNLSGEGPRKTYLNENLLSAIRRARHRTPGSDGDLLQWLLESIEESSAR